ncbi:MAG: MBL fold metallo-hydrolase [Candidatus Heimdallarchaeota archaeon]
MHVTFLMNATEVGRASILLQEAKTKLVLDSGILPGAKPEQERIPKDPGPIQALILSHAHLDHSGYVPALLKKYKSKFIATPATQDLSEILWHDSLKIARQDDHLEPLFDTKDIQRVRKFAIDGRYRVYMPIKGQNLGVQLFSAGHILGSSMIRIKSKNSSLLYTGDINTRHTRTLDTADEQLPPIKTLIIESTYGGPKDKHSSLKKVEQDFISAIRDTLLNNGKVIIAAYAVGRAQEAMLVLEAYMRSGAIPTVPIWIDGMISSVNERYKLYWEWLRPEIQREIRYTQRSPLDAPIFHPVNNGKTRKTLIKDKKPWIVVTTSGMLQGGPVIRYLKAFGKDDKNLICLTGYQAPETRGRALINGSRTLTLDDEPYNIGAQVKQFEFSAHADQPGLLRFVSHLKGLKKVFVIHGENSKPKLLAKRIESLIDGVEAFVPDPGEGGIAV